MTNTSDKCNGVVLSHISYWICVNENGLIYFERHQGTNDTRYDEALRLFYERTQAMINEELDQTKLNMMNDRDWSEVYAIQQQGEERKKLCDYVSIMKLCINDEAVNDAISDVNILSAFESCSGGGDTCRLSAAIEYLFKIMELRQICCERQKIREICCMMNGAHFKFKEEGNDTLIQAKEFQAMMVSWNVLIGSIYNAKYEFSLYQAILCTSTAIFMLWNNGFIGFTKKENIDENRLYIVLDRLNTHTSSTKYTFSVAKPIGIIGISLLSTHLNDILWGLEENLLLGDDRGYDKDEFDELCGNTPSTHPPPQTHTTMQCAYVLDWIQKMKSKRNIDDSNQITFIKDTLNAKLRKQIDQYIDLYRAKWTSARSYKSDAVIERTLENHGYYVIAKHKDASIPSIEESFVSVGSFGWQFSKPSDSSVVYANGFNDWMTRLAKHYSIYRCLFCLDTYKTKDKAE
eukprot:328960_1